MASETWRVVLESGEVCAVGVTHYVAKRRWEVDLPGDVSTTLEARHARGAIMQACEGVAIAEILAPGEPTRAEAVAAERERLIVRIEEAASDCNDRGEDADTEGDPEECDALLCARGTLCELADALRAEATATTADAVTPAVSP